MEYLKQGETMPVLNCPISERDHKFLLRYKQISGLSIAAQVRVALQEWRLAHAAECQEEDTALPGEENSHAP